MPTSPPRQCTRCRRPVPSGQRCPCTPAWSNPSASTNTTSTRRWRKVRAAKLANDPVCEDPAGCPELAVTVDHIVPLAEDGERYDWDNLRSLCEPHHKAKTAQDAARGRARRRQG